MVIERLAVVGAGQMGSGIAQVGAQAALEVVLADATVALARAGLERISAALGQAGREGQDDAGDRTALLARIKPAERLEECSRAQLAHRGGGRGRERRRRSSCAGCDGLLPARAILASQHLQHLDHQARRRRRSGPSA